MPESKILQFLIVLFFAGSVVAFGAHDLTTKHMFHMPFSRTGKGMAKEFHGDKDMDSSRASFSRDPDEAEEPIKVEGKGRHDMDRLDRRDRSKLKDLLDKVVP